MANEEFAAGNYSTAFIPDFYPDGYTGDDLDDSQMQILALAAHQLKNISSDYYKDAASRCGDSNKVVYITILAKGDEGDRDWKVEHGCDSYTVTCMASGNSSEHKMNDFAFEHNSLIKMHLENQGK